MNGFKEKLARFMAGRYGTDALYTVILTVCIILAVVNLFVRSEVYSGVYGRASINFYAFNSNGNKGIACGLNNLQKIRDGEPLGGKPRAEDDFATADDDDFLA